MKKLIAMLLAGAMILSFSACTSNEDPIDTNDETEATTPAEEEESVGTPLEVLTTVWNNYDEANKFFAMGGSNTAPVDNAPGAVDLANTDFFAASLVCSADCVAMIDDAASLLHSMNANTFTGAVYHLADAANQEAFTTAMQEAINNNQWMCGFPEKLYIATLDSSTVVVAFGAAEVVDVFVAELGEAYTATVVVDAPLA